jgi:spoIIIJ-associated protein
MLSVVGGRLNSLVGQRGEVLEALQDLTRLAVQQQTGERSRLMLDVGGWRERRRAELAELGRTTAESVRDSGTSRALTPMTPFERKIVHDAVATVDGVRSESEGDDPDRYVVILPA